MADANIQENDYMQLPEEKKTLLVYSTTGHGKYMIFNYIKNYLCIVQPIIENA